MVLAGNESAPMPINDDRPVDGVAVDQQTDPHGQAALLLVESLIHVLRERSILSLADAIDLVETAASVQADVTAQADGAAPIMRRSLLLLESIADSLRREAEAVSGRA